MKGFAPSINLSAAGSAVATTSAAKNAPPPKTTKNARFEGSIKAAGTHRRRIDVPKDKIVTPTLAPMRTRDSLADRISRRVDVYFPR